MKPTAITPRFPCCKNKRLLHVQQALVFWVQTICIGKETDKDLRALLFFGGLFGIMAIPKLVKKYIEKRDVLYEHNTC